jgi:hypothetical protein
MSTLLLAFIFILQVHAIEFRSEYGVDAAGALSRKIVMSCSDSESSICKKECEMSSCRVVEPTCVNCAGSSSELLQVLFSKVTQFYKRSNPINQVENTLVHLIREQKLVLLDSQSLFNFFTNISEKESLVEFKKLCPAGTYQAINRYAG